MTEKKQIEIKHFNTKGSLAEIYQRTGFYYAFISEKMEQCHPWAKCRDFLHDAVRTQITGNTSAIYGFKFEKGKNPDIDLSKMRIALIQEGAQSGGTTFENKMNAAISVLNHFEKYAGIPLSTMKKVKVTGPKAKSEVYLFTGSSVWVRSPFLVSMYTFLIRLGDKELKFKSAWDLRKKLKALSESTTSRDNDVNYLKTLWPKLHKILKNRRKLFKEQDGFHDIYFKGHAISSFHNQCGVLSLANGRTPDSELNNLVKKET